MSDLISRDALKRLFNEECAGDCNCCGHHDGNAEGSGCKLLDKAPTVDAAPVVHGRWLCDDLGHTYCSECHERLPYIHCYSEEPGSDYDEEWDEEMPETLYCPHCSAKMDEEG